MECTKILIWNNATYTVRRITVEDSDGNIIYTGDDFKVNNDVVGLVRNETITKYYIKAKNFLTSNNLSGTIICSKKSLTLDHSERYTPEVVFKE